jgi:formamidopyrimidine-DNA glycosylase
VKAALEVVSWKSKDGATIEGVRRRGKLLLLDLSGDLMLSMHRRMTGNFLLLPPGWTAI